MTEHREMSVETREFLDGLTREDIQTIQAGLPIIRAVLGFGKVTKWLAIIIGGLLAGILFLGESVTKILGWLSGTPPHP